MESAVDLRGADSEACCYTDDGCKDSDAVNPFSKRSVDFVAEDRKQRRADQARRVFSEFKVRDAKSNDRIDRPCMQSPVENVYLRESLKAWAVSVSPDGELMAKWLIGSAAP